MAVVLSGLQLESQQLLDISPFKIPAEEWDAVASGNTGTSECSEILLFFNGHLNTKRTSYIQHYLNIIEPQGVAVLQGSAAFSYRMI
ncbi:hypothetical protein XELAEV_18000096mg [Xenopus laevis]|uniref:Uncharacterized protein n=1 Tax=Xenopus laevis TaxID=8355 RepID=A0A974BP98_XENLA|nr:hypothetical protein XELAEV_18000096mg [Xenopus laevis]